MKLYQKSLTALLLLLLFSFTTCKTVSNNENYWLNRRYLQTIEDSMDLEAHPCDNFYQYACGRWEENHKDPTNKYNEMLSMVDYEVNEELACSFDKISLKGQPRFMQKAYNYYQSCIHMGELNHSFYKTWIQEKENFRWPKISTVHSSSIQYDWVYTLAMMRKYGLNGIFIEEMMIHKKDDRRRTMVDVDKPVDVGGFIGLTYENLKDLMKYLNINYSTKVIEKLWHTISTFEGRLLELYEIEDDEGSKSIKIKDLPLPWLRKYLAIILNQTTLDPNMEIYIQNIPYMEALYDLLKKYDDHFICRYLEVRFLWHLQQHGPRDFSRGNCVQSTRSLMPLAMHWFYEQQHPQVVEHIPSIHHMFRHIVEHFNSTLLANHMNFNTTILQHLLLKLDRIQLKIGNLPRINTINVLESFYSNLTLDAGDFYGNHLKLLRFLFEMAHASIPHTLTTNVNHFFNLEIYGEGSRSSPYFLPRANIIMVPLSSLRQPLYHPHYETIYKYSSLGSSLAHEIFHGFDRVGLSVDFSGRINYWQFKNVLANPSFKRKYNCLRELYPDVVDEKIADISGLRLAYETYFSMFPENVAATRRINDMEISFEKLFFLNFAQLYCDTNVSDGEHGNVNDRINDALSHYQKFSKAFGCSRQSRMLSVNSCQLWQ